VDIREYIEDPEEMLRTSIKGELKNHFWTLPVIIGKDSSDGHTATADSAVMGQVTQPDGTIKKVKLPSFDDMPIHFMQGGGVTSTHPVKKGDEGVVMFMNRPQDAWHESGGTQPPIDERINSLSDGRYIPGGRSNPRKLKNVSTEAHHTRSDDGKHTHETHPTNGFKTKSVDPSDTSDDPFNAATKFYESVVKGASGIAHNATSGGTTHSVTNTHDSGPQMAANNGEHTINAHPSGGAKIMSTSGLMKIAGQIESTIAGFKFPDGSIQKSAAVAIATFTGGSSSSGGPGATFPAVASDTPLTVAGHQQTNGPAFAAHALVATSIANAVSTLIILDNVEFDTNTCFNASTGRFTPNVPGYYQINGGNGLTAAQNKLTISVFKNGVEFRRGVQSASGGLQVTISCLVFLNGTSDYVDLRLYHEAGSAQNSLIGIPLAYFDAAMVRGL
jgi:hypothetical protein